MGLRSTSHAATSRPPCSKAQPRSVAGRIAGLWLFILAVCAGPASAQEQTLQEIPEYIRSELLCWRDRTLPAQFFLDPDTGDVGDRETPASIGYDGSRLVAGEGLRLWSIPKGLDPAVPYSLRPQPAPPAGHTTAPVQVGDAFLFATTQEGPHEGARGYLKVLATSQAELRLELALTSPNAFRIVRDPARVQAEGCPEGVRLSWPVLAPDVEYWVEALNLADPDGPPGRAHRVVGGEWLDRRDGSSPEALVEYRVWRVGGPVSAFGARVRGLRVEHPGELPLTLDRGQQVDLLSGTTGGTGGDVEVLYAKPPSVTLRPLAGTKLTTISTSQAGWWTVPHLDEGTYDFNTRSFQLGQAFACHLREGIYMRLTIVADGAGGVALLRQWDPEGMRLLPKAPAPPGAVWTPSGPRFTFPPLLPGSCPPDRVSLVVERERTYRSNDWQEVLVGEMGLRTLTVPARGEARPLVRYRFRHRMDSGAESAPSEPLPILHGDTGDPEQVDRWVQEAFEDLLHEQFARRLEARGVLEILHGAALTRLEQALRADDPELAAAARQILLSGPDEGGVHVALLLRSQARAEGVPSDPPAGMTAAEPGLRAWALVKTCDAAQAVGKVEVFEQWRGILARADPDPGVSALALMLARTPARSPLAANRYPVQLIPPSQRPAVQPPDWRWLLIEEGPAALAAAARKAVQPWQPDLALELLTLARTLELRAASPDRSSLGGEQALDAELALRLLDRHQPGSGDPYLRAAAALFPDFGPRLIARRELADLRAAFGPAPERRRVELPVADLVALQAQLENLVSEHASYVDLILPPGDYKGQSSLPTGWLELSVPGLRLVGGEGVRLETGLRVNGVQDVVLDSLQIHNTRGPALYITRGSVLARDLELSGLQTTIQVDRSRVELERCECRPDPVPRGAQWSLRSSVDSTIIARGTLFGAGALQAGNEVQVDLDRCVLDGGARPAFQGSRGCSASLRDVLIRSRDVGLANVSHGIAVGVVFDTRGAPVGGGLEGTFGVSPTLHQLVGETPPLDRRFVLDSCPLDQ